MYKRKLNRSVFFVYIFVYKCLHTCLTICVKGERFTTCLQAFICHADIYQKEILIISPSVKAPAAWFCRQWKSWANGSFSGDSGLSVSAEPCWCWDDLLLSGSQCHLLCSDVLGPYNDAKMSPQTYDKKLQEGWVKCKYWWPLGYPCLQTMEIPMVVPDMFFFRSNRWCAHDLWSSETGTPEVTLCCQKAFSD